MHFGDLGRVTRFCLADVDGQRIHDLLTINTAVAIARTEAGAASAVHQS
jgi:hypothetical protein